jgi:Fur family ferric uptake transcriptional regulator
MGQHLQLRRLQMQPLAGSLLPMPTALEVKALLRNAGLRATSARALVYESLASAQGPLTHAEVCAILEGQGLDRATIYRNLADLTEAELVRRTDHGDHLWRFELAGDERHHDPDPHPHFVCTECGKVSCLPEGAVVVSAVKGSPRTMKRGAYELQVRGACDACA